MTQWSLSIGQHLLSPDWSNHFSHNISAQGPQNKILSEGGEHWDVERLPIVHTVFYFLKQNVSRFVRNLEWNRNREEGCACAPQNTSVFN